MSFWSIVVIAIVIIVVFKVVGKYLGNRPVKPATEEEKAQWKKNHEELNKRFKEAAQNGVLPEKVEGFKELPPSLSGIPAYTVVKGICMKLVNNGYTVRYGYDAKDRDRGCLYASIYVYEGEIEYDEQDKKHLGSIEFQECKFYSSLSSIRTASTSSIEFSLRQIIERIEKGELEKLTYTIEADNSGIFISSKVSPPEAVPEWLMVCADELKLIEPPVSAKWLEQYPAAQKYVNVMF